MQSALLLGAMASSGSAEALRVGVIGTGCIGIEHLQNLHLLPHARVTAIADPHPASLSRATECLSSLGDLDGVAVLSDYEELIALPQVDALILCTPNDHHALALPAIVASGKHCLVEKPLCTSVGDCARVAALVEQGRARGALYWCGMEYRYIPSIARLVREASEGGIGELRMLSIREHRFPFLQKVGHWNRYNARSGGTLVEKCCHFFDLMRLILRSEPYRIMATGGQDVNFLDEEHDGRPADTLDNAYVLVEFTSGARACLELCMFAEASKHQEELSLVGTRGKMEAFSPSHGTKTDDESEVNFRRCLRNPAFTSGAWDRTEPPSPEECGTIYEAHEAVDRALLEAGNHAGATYVELSRFVHAAQHGLPAEVSVADGALAALMGIAAQRSVQTGNAVLWSDIMAEYEAAAK
ncbi:hypothetical protein AB1Y20_001828 [Prymnesium parvum]|uniref:Oxidoreductase n=1 Tax=Prymnesium parvum TaxID=97485 RepID=A0AB34KCB9_PRYPA